MTAPAYAPIAYQRHVNYQPDATERPVADDLDADLIEKVTNGEITLRRARIEQRGRRVAVKTSRTQADVHQALAIIDDLIQDAADADELALSSTLAGAYHAVERFRDLDRSGS